MRAKAERADRRTEKRGEKYAEKHGEKIAETRTAEQPTHILAGRHAIVEAIKAGRGINRILLADGLHGGAVYELRDLARAHGITVDTVGRAKLDAVVPDGRSPMSRPSLMSPLRRSLRRHGRAERSLCCSSSTASRIRRTSVHCCARRMRLACTGFSCRADTAFP